MKGKIILAIVLACVVGCFIYYGVEEFWKPRSEQDATATESSNLNHTGGEDDTQEEQSKKVISNEKKETTDIIPAYSGKPYCELGGNVPLFTEEEKKSTDAFEYYSDLDSLGRCGIVFANVCRELMPVEERGTIGNIRPSGWHTVKYNDLIDGNYLYNRCHLLGYQITA
ncbi:MAG: DNA/RNA non-specific endonuclease, partial [Eubacterium sp.]|nr:DNA/RNA non-specific endonuclease [Eubacterium sp.]